MPGPSYGGDTSTTSQPTRSMPRSARTNASASAVEKPPTSGVPVPGANAGSRKSMSNDTKTGLSPAFVAHELAVSRRAEVAQLVGRRDREAEVARVLDVSAP